MQRLGTEGTPTKDSPSVGTEPTSKKAPSGFTFDPSISLGNILTLATIAISAFTAFRAWNQDNFLREKEQADKIRTAAAQTSAKLERWEAVSLSFFNDIQPAFVQASNTFATNYDVAATRDGLWKELDAKKQQNLEKLLDEDIETAYVGLYGYNPAMRPLLRQTMSHLNTDSETMVAALQADTQQVVLDFQGKVDGYRAGKESYQTAAMGNALRQVAYDRRQAYTQQIESELKCMQDFLASLVLKTNADLVYGRSDAPCTSP
jgi:hypothetical protein